MLLRIAQPQFLLCAASITVQNNVMLVAKLKSYVKHVKQMTTTQLLKNPTNMSTDLLQLNVDTLFEQHGVSEVDAVQKKIQTVVENKREELRTMVG